MSIIIDEDLCTGCATCVENCPYGVIKIIDNKAVITTYCHLCGACVDDCPVDAIILESRGIKTDKVNISQYKGIWVIAEHFNNEM